MPCIHRSHRCATFLGGSLPASDLADYLDRVSAVSVLPGVKSASDYSSKLYVRGGSPDQTLILLDGARVAPADRNGNVTEHFFNEQHFEILRRELTRGLRAGGCDVAAIAELASTGGTKNGHSIYFYELTAPNTWSFVQDLPSPDPNNAYPMGEIELRMSANGVRTIADCRFCGAEGEGQGRGERADFPVPRPERLRLLGQGLLLFGELPTVPRTCAPAALASCVSMRPTAPPMAWTRMVSPRRIRWAVWIRW